MYALVLALSASLFTALASFLFRKNSDQQPKSPSGYLVLFYLFSFLLCFSNPELWQKKVSFLILGFGMVVGIFNSTLMVLTAKALKNGPSGLTFAFQNASAIFPGLLLFLTLGSQFGFSCSLLQILGMICVLIGLFLGANSNNKISYRWLKYALTCFGLQIINLTLMQLRCVLFDCEQKGWLNFGVSEMDDIWFMPGLFGAALLMQSLLFFKERRKLKKRELFCGSLGGVANFLSTLLLLLATKEAGPFEKSILFPAFAVAAMILCNLWAKVLYQEDFNFKSNFLCSAGILIAVV